MVWQCSQSLWAAGTGYQGADEEEHTEVDRLQKLALTAYFTFLTCFPKSILSTCHPPKGSNSSVNSAPAKGLGSGLGPKSQVVDTFSLGDRGGRAKHKAATHWGEGNVLKTIHSATAAFWQRPSEYDGFGLRV